MTSKLNPTQRFLAALLLALAIPHQLTAAGPAVLDLRSTANFTILAGAGITTTGGGTINGDVGASPIAGSAIGVSAAQVNGTIYAVDASGPAGSVIDPARLTTAKGDLTTAYNDAAGRTPIPTGPFLNPGLIPGSGDIGGMTLAPGLYKFTTTANITLDVTLTGGADDVWIFQCAQDLQLASGMKVIMAGGAQAKNVFWQVGTSAVLGTFSVFKGTILADQSITMNTSSTMDGRALAFSAGITYNGTAAALPRAPEIGVSQPLGTDLVDGVSTKDFGSVLVGANTNLIFTITNSGDANLTITGPITFDGLDAALFSVTSSPVSPVIPGGSTTFTVRFAPLTAGVKSAALHIANNDSDEAPFDIFLAGTGSVGPEIGVSQPLGTDLVDGVSIKDFGSVGVGGSTNLIFTITNSGNADLTITNPITFDGLDAALFSLTSPPISPVIPGGSTTFTVRFAPLTIGAKIAALHIANNDSDENPFDITLTGTSVAAPEIAISQPLGTDLPDGGSKDFGSVLLGGSTSLIFTITNSGTANLTLTLPITFDGLDAALFSVTAPPTTPVIPGGSTTFTVRFAPVTTGAKVAALHLVNNDGDENPFDLTLTGNGTVAPEIGISQPLGTDLVDGVSTRDFGSVLVGASSSLTFTITNSGNANLILTLPITFDGLDAALFTVTTPPTTPVVPAGSTTFTVRFAPLTGGPKAAALHLVNNDADESPFDIALTGNSTIAPEIAVSQPLGTDIADGGSKNFGPVLVGASTSLTFTITNSGSADLTITGPITFDGVDAALFSVTTAPTTPVIPGGSTTFTVRFAPLTTGAKAAALHIVNNDADENPFDIALTGTGSGAIVVSASPIVLNPQTAHFEQTVRVTNSSASTLAAIRLLIPGLPVDVEVRNASGTNGSGIPFAQHNFPLAGSGIVDFFIEYYRPSRVPFASPVFAAEATIATPATAIGTIVDIYIQRAPMQAGRFFIEFPVTPGRTYAVQYSSDLVTWKTANPFLSASPDNRVQWYDDGPPKTESLPTAIGSRFYRAILLP